MVGKTIDAISSRSRKVDGTPTSLTDLGYQRVGVDDGWQACKKGKDCTFHSDDGTPVVNTTKFPDLSALVKYGEAKQVLVGWYQINCICCDEFSDTDNATWKKSVYTADAKQLTDAGFYGVKLDDCGDGTGEGLIGRVKAINASGRAMLIENSNQGVGGPAPAKPHNGRDNPKDAEAPCPFNLFRTGGDIIPDFGTVIAKLQRTIPYLGNKSFAPISRPGCWAYPDSESRRFLSLPPSPTPSLPFPSLGLEPDDTHNQPLPHTVLEVGNFPSEDPAKAFLESRTHFGAWCVVSSPLVLGLDITNDTTLDSVWDIISNK